MARRNTGFLQMIEMRYCKRCGMITPHVIKDRFSKGQKFWGNVLTFGLASIYVDDDGETLYHRENICDICGQVKEIKK